MIAVVVDHGHQRLPVSNGWLMLVIDFHYDLVVLLMFLVVPGAVVHDQNIILVHLLGLVMHFVVYDVFYLDYFANNIGFQEPELLTF